MKKIFLFFLSLITITLSLFSTTIKAEAFTPLDYIESYKIVVTPNDDATLSMDYTIKWKVLDSSSEGPLEWVKIGVPNRFVENIKPLSPEIKKAYYYADDGAYIRLDLAKKYYKDSVVDLHFSFLQKRIFSKNNGDIAYGFIPGWFPEIKVGQIEVFWDDTKAPLFVDETATHVEGYYYWTDSLEYNETIKCNIKYSKDVFPTIDLSMDYSDEYETFMERFLPLIIFFIFVAIFLTAFCLINANKDRYLQYRGFSGANYYYHPWWYMHHSNGVDKSGKKIVPPTIKSGGSSGHSGGSSCACACACACAGGGRAGCARKDFYPPKVKIENINNTK